MDIALAHGLAYQQGFHSALDRTRERLLQRKDQLLRIGHPVAVNKSKLIDEILAELTAESEGFQPAPWHPAPAPA